MFSIFHGIFYIPFHSIPGFRYTRSKPPARIDRWLLRLSQFDYQVEHTPENFNIADFFSRYPVEITPIENIADKYINMAMNYAIPNAGQSEVDGQFAHRSLMFITFYLRKN